MKYLLSQEELEQLIGRAPSDTPLPNLTVIWFSAAWCGPCKRVPIDTLMALYPLINWLKCDIDQNDYTAGYCGIRSIPAFLAISKKKILGSLASSDGNEISNWIKNLKLE